MAATIETPANTADTGTTSDTEVSMPSGIEAGDLLMVFYALKGSVTRLTESSGLWTHIFENNAAATVTGGCFAKIATGGDTLTVSRIAIETGEASSGEDFACSANRITGHGVDDVTTDIKMGTAATGADDAPNPPACNGGVVKDWLVIEHFAADDDDNTGTFQSTGYTQVAQVQSDSSATSCLCSVAYLALDQESSEDPGVMAMAAVEEWVAQTYMIPPYGVTLTVEPAAITVSGSPVGLRHAPVYRGTMRSARRRFRAR